MPKERAPSGKELTLSAIASEAANIARHRFDPGVFGVSECVRTAAAYRVESSVLLMERCRLVAGRCITVWELDKSPSDAVALLTRAGSVSRA